MRTPDYYRHAFPSLTMTALDGSPCIFFDNPAGTQVPQRVIDAVSTYYRTANANRHGAFLTSQRTEDVLQDAHQALADLVNAASPDDIATGPNMTTLSFALSYAVARQLQPGDEVVSSRLEHDAHLAPWLVLQRERGIHIRYIEVTPDLRLDLESARDVISPRTKVVAITYASNAVGSITDVSAICALAQQVGAHTIIDAVQYAPHGLIDVRAVDCDFLLCSAYKFFGPHQGFLYGKRARMDDLVANHVRSVPNRTPDKFEMGTQNHECLAGTTAAVSYLANLGTDLAVANGRVAPLGRRASLVEAMTAIKSYEETLVEHLLRGLAQIKGVRVWGVTDITQLRWRVPTVAITYDGIHPDTLAAWLGKHHIFVWSGNFYAQEIIDHLDLTAAGGVVRIGLAHYNTRDEVDRFLTVLDDARHGVPD